MTIDATREREMIREGQLMLKGGMSPHQLKQQWRGFGVTETRANQMLAATQNLKKFDAQARRSSQRTALIAIAILAMVILAFAALALLRG